MFSENFQTKEQSITCSRPICRTGPFGGLASGIFWGIGIVSVSPARVIEIALSTRDDLPASICRLFEDGSQANTSGVSVSWNSALTNLSASRGSLELMARMP